jgi:TatD DNase family protein
MIDSHCHLDHENLLNDLENVILRSKEVGITKLLTICTTLESFNRIKEILKKDDSIYGTFGIHPHETKTNIINKYDIIKNINENKKVIGIGETGLDFYYNHSDKEKQIKSFNEHIEAALEVDKPIIIHSRNAEIETFDILNNYKNKCPKILMHCFTGSLDFSKKLLSLNSFFSASGIITFKKTQILRDTFKTIPLEKLLIETDSPFLAPEPKRGNNNEPSYIKYTAKVLSELKKISYEDLLNKTTINFNNLFFNK